MESSSYIHKTDYTFDAERLYTEYKALARKYKLEQQTQISLTGFTEKDSWSCSTGVTDFLEYPEQCYYKTLKPIKGTYLEKCMNDFPSFYRWRLLVLNPRTCYSIHRDFERDPSSVNIRIHLPIVTNTQSYMCFYKTDSKRHALNYNIEDGVQEVLFNNLKAGIAYNTCTTFLHSAINHGKEPRIHLVGVTGVNLKSIDEIPDVLKNLR